MVGGRRRDRAGRGPAADVVSDFVADHERVGRLGILIGLDINGLGEHVGHHQFVRKLAALGGEPEIFVILFSAAQVDTRIREVAAEISRDFAGRELKMIGVLKGSVFFLTALALEIAVPVRMDFLAISRFTGQRSPVSIPGMRSAVPSCGPRARS